MHDTTVHVVWNLGVLGGTINPLSLPVYQVVALCCLSGYNSAALIHVYRVSWVRIPPRAAQFSLIVILLNMYMHMCM